MSTVALRSGDVVPIEVPLSSLLEVDLSRPVVNVGSDFILPEVYIVAGDFSGRGVLSAEAQFIATSPGPFSGLGTLAASVRADGGIKEAAASLSGSGTLSATRVIRFQRTAALSGAGTLAAQSVASVRASLSGDGTLAVATKAVAPVMAQLSGLGTLSSTVTAEGGSFAVTAALSGVGTLSAARVIRFNRSAALSGLGTLSASVIEREVVNVSFNGAGTLSAQSVVQTRAPLAGEGVLSAEAYIAAPTIMGVEFGTPSTSQSSVAVAVPAATKSGDTLLYVGVQRQSNTAPALPGGFQYITSFNWGAGRILIGRRTWVDGDPTQYSFAMSSSQVHMVSLTTIRSGATFRTPTTFVNTANSTTIPVPAIEAVNIRSLLIRFAVTNASNATFAWAASTEYLDRLAGNNQASMSLAYQDIATPQTVAAENAVTGSGARAAFSLIIER